MEIFFFFFFFFFFFCAMYVIAGVTGHTGRVVAETLLAKGQPIRTVLRDETK